MLWLWAAINYGFLSISQEAIIRCLSSTLPCARFPMRRVSVCRICLLGTYGWQVSSWNRSMPYRFEETGSCIVKNATGRAAEVVCDPTMLLTKEEWCSVKALDYRVPSEPYILCYFMGTNIWNRYCAEVLARNRGCKILAIVHPDEYVAFDEKYANYKPYDVGPAQFLQLVSHAKYICTDSFHGTVFATLFNKQFFSFRRHENLGSQSTNSRLDTLLSRLGLESRLCESVGEFDSACCEDVDFDRVNAKVESFRLESLAWLRTSLGIEEPFDDMH